MKKLPFPKVDFSRALNVTISGIKSEKTKVKYTTAFVDPITIERTYQSTAEAANLFALQRLGPRDGDQIVLGTLRKSDLTKLYTQYFVPEKKPARSLYQEIKVIANGKCPLCGGIGHVQTLDHYLPKAHYPLYSIMPTNLVPCCRDCNSKKLSEFPSMRGDQPLHPYFDHDRFFLEKWLYARVIQGTLPVLEFFVDPPSHWDIDDKSRVRSHFIEFELEKRFSMEAAADLPETIRVRQKYMSSCDSKEFSRYLAEKSRTTTFPINNWRRVMFAALAADNWFCSQTFANWQ